MITWNHMQMVTSEKHQEAGMHDKLWLDPTECRGAWQPTAGPHWAQGCMTICSRNALSAGVHDNLYLECTECRGAWQSLSGMHWAQGYMTICDWTALSTGVHDNLRLDHTEHRDSTEQKSMLCSYHLSFLPHQFPAYPVKGHQQINKSYKQSLAVPDSTFDRKWWGLVDGVIVVPCSDCCQERLDLQSIRKKSGIC